MFVFWQVRVPDGIWSLKVKNNAIKFILKDDAENINRQNCSLGNQDYTSVMRVYVIG